MPANQHLTWVEIKDFAPGLWNISDWLMPATGWQIMEDAYPQQGGGIRAFHKATSVTVSGIGTIAKERVLGLFSRGNIAARVGKTGGQGTDRYLVTYLFNSAASVGSKARPVLYRMDDTNDETVWAEVPPDGHSHFTSPSDDNNNPSKVSFRYFNQLADGADLVFFVLRYGGTDSGLWYVPYSTVTASSKAENVTGGASGSLQMKGAMAVHQARLLVSGGANGEETVFYSNAGDAKTFSATGFLEVEPSQIGSTIGALVPEPPSDLLVLKEGAPTALVQGEISSQTTQAMAGGLYFALQDVPFSPLGLFAIAASGYIYKTDGVTFDPISRQLQNFTKVPDANVDGDVNFIGDFVFAPGGLVWHTPTASWFTQTQMAGSFHNVDLDTRAIWGPVGTGVSFTLAQINPFEVSGADRVHTWHVKSSPLRSVDGRRLGIREVQLYVKSYDANAQLTVTVNGKANTITCPVTGRQQLSFLFKEKAEVLDVDIVSTAGNAANEAPSVEVIRLGFMPGTNLAPSE